MDRLLVLRIIAGGLALGMLCVMMIHRKLEGRRSVLGTSPTDTLEDI